jgi:NAD(P)-dependent dehydrogenase (short-subunit alcohol dehydrogenase family)
MEPWSLTSPQQCTRGTSKHQVQCRRSYHGTAAVARQNGNFQRDDVQEEDSQYSRNNSSSSSQRQVLVLGSSGALGSVIARHLSSDDEMGHNNAMQVLGADVHAEIPSELYLDDWQLHDFVHLKPTTTTTTNYDVDDDSDDSLASLIKQLWRGTAKFLQENNSPGLDAIICASGGWTMDIPPTYTMSSSSSSSSWMQQAEQMTDSVDAYAASVRAMRVQNLEPVLAAAHLVSHMKCMNPHRDGLVVVLGAAAALSSSTPGMLSYGLAKSAAHRVVQTLGAATATSLESKSVRQAAREHYHTSNDRSNGGNLAISPHPMATASAGLYRTTFLGILPTMLDTHNNRTALPPDVNVAAATASWTKPRDIAHQIGAWITEPAAARPHSGALLKVYPKKSPPSHRRGGGGESLDLDDDDDDTSNGAVFELVR